MKFWLAIYDETEVSGWVTTRGTLYYSPEELKEVFNKFHDKNYHSPAIKTNMDAYWTWMGNDPAPGKKGGQQADRVNFDPWPTGTMVTDKDRVAALRALQRTAPCAPGRLHRWPARQVEPRLLPFVAAVCFPTSPAVDNYQHQRHYPLSLDP